MSEWFEAAVFVESEGRRYLALEHIEGETLAQRLSRGMPAARKPARQKAAENGFMIVENWFTEFRRK